MSSKEAAYQEAYHLIHQKYRPLHNLLTKTMLEQKVRCFQHFGHSPIEYYQCFDKT